MRNSTAPPTRYRNRKEDKRESGARDRFEIRIDRHAIPAIPPKERKPASCQRFVATDNK